MTKTTIIGLALAALSTLATVPAHAGRGGSYGAIRAAVQKNAIDSIIAELERAEDIPCVTACMELVMDLTGHDDLRVREVAAWWLARRPAQKAEMTDVALAALATGDALAVRNAADVLGTFSAPASVAPLATAYRRSGLTAEARVAVVRALGRIAHRSASAPLGEAMADADAAVRREAVVAWRRILRQDGAAPVAALVSDADTLVRREAASVVGMFREASARAALEAVVTSDADPMVRRNAAWALGRIGDAASRAALEAAATDSSGLVRMTAKASLRQLR